MEPIAVVGWLQMNPFVSTRIICAICEQTSRSMNPCRK